MPDWAVTAPHSASDLAQTLSDGIPGHTVVWLDEPQDRLTATPPGLNADVENQNAQEAQDALAWLLADRGTDTDITKLRHCVHAGYGSGANRLLDLYRAQPPDRHAPREC